MANVPQTLFLQGVFLKDLVTMENLFGSTSNNEVQCDDSSSHIFYTSTFDENGHSNISQQNILKNSFNNSYDYEVNYREPEIITYDKTPKIFKSIKDWPTRTNIKCIHCAFSITYIPIPIPTAVEITKNSERIFDICEVCCSFSCAARRIYETTQNSSFRWQRMSMLKLIKGIFNKELYKQESISQQFGLKYKDNKSNKMLNDDIPLAPKKRDICHFGGDITQKEFKHIIHKLDLKIMKLS